VQSGNSVVGTGSSASCTEAAFDTVFNTVETSGGGTITFKCGLAPHTIIFTAQKSVSANTDINGRYLITLSGGNATSLFQVYSGQSMTISHLTLSRGYGTFGAVENFGSLNINSSQVVNNTATISGGAIANHNDLSLTNAVIANNTAAQFGGGIYTDAGITTIVNSQFKNNTATSGGGAIATILGVSLTIHGSHFSGNKTTDTFAQGGAIRNEGTLVITQSTFSQNNASRGGALFEADGSADVSQSTISGNWAAYGGGIRQEGGDLILTDVKLASNGYASNGAEVTTGGGAISWGSGNATITNVTINGNWASYGGGFDHEGGTTTLTNVTFSGNSAVGSGAIDQGGGSIDLTNVTIVGNNASFYGGIGNRSGTMTFKNTLLSNNFNLINNQSENCYLPIATSSFSMSSDSTCGFGTGYDNLNLLLGPLAYNGGFTPTYLLKKGSLAIDAGTGIGCPPTDQRGVTRPQGQACDIGAVEVAPADLLLKVYLPLLKR
jgi:predicted outer membrane repeat protein